MKIATLKAESNKIIKIGTRVSLAGSRLTLGTIIGGPRWSVAFSDMLVRRGAMKKPSSVKIYDVRWDSGKVGSCEPQDLETL